MVGDSVAATVASRRKVSLGSGVSGEFASARLAADGAPQAAAGGGTDRQFSRGGVRVERGQSLQRTPVAEPIVSEIAGHRHRLEEQLADAQRAATDGVHHRGVGVRAESVGQDSPLRHLGHPQCVPERSLAREGHAHHPIQEHRILRSDDLLERAQLRDAGRRYRDPLLRRQVVVFRDDPDRGRVGRYRGQWDTQIAPGRRQADIGQVQRSAGLPAAA